MSMEGLVFTGRSPVSHPVLDRLFGGLDLDACKSADDLANARLVVIDARLAGDDLAAGGIAHNALAAGVPVLIVAPREGQLVPLAATVGAVPRAPQQAVFLAPNANRSEPNRFEATALAYPLGSAARSDDAALAEFAAAVRERVATPYRAVAVDLPDGLRFLLTHWNFTYPFTSSKCDSNGKNCFKNGEGSLTVSADVWGFLSQSAAGNAQYLVVEAVYALNPGKLASNSDTGRGFLNVRLASALHPDDGFAPIDHIPTNGTDSWNDSFTLAISYLDPLSQSYKVFRFDANVAQSIKDWSVQNTSTAADLGSQWFINSPINGTKYDFNEAFTGSGYVQKFPSASTGTLTAKEASAWRTDTIRQRVTLSGTWNWKESVFYATSCGLFFCYGHHEHQSKQSAGDSFEVDLSSILP